MLETSSWSRLTNLHVLVSHQGIGRQNLVTFANYMLPNVMRA